MLKRVIAIAFIFICTTIAWAILGGTIFSRTYSADGRLEGKVASSWGTQQTQAPPSASYDEPRTRSEESIVDGRKITREIRENSIISVPLESSRINVNLGLDHRQTGLLWYSTYSVDFTGRYTFRNPSTRTEEVHIQLPFPASQAVYDNLQVQVGGQPVPLSTNSNGASVQSVVAAGATVPVVFSYRSQGLGHWSYTFGNDVSQVRDFVLDMKTNFAAIDFPADTLSPTEKHKSANGWELSWKYTSLLSGMHIGMAMPEKLQPGPLAGQISFFAPVSLFFFFFLVFIITTLRGIDLHPMNYFFIATGFFAFHLLMAYLVDHISIHMAFVICSLVSVFLVVSYLRLVVGVRFAAVEAGLAQLIYLVLFSYAFFYKGFTGLAITIGSIVTLFVVMQMTGRIKWAERFASKAA